MFSLKKYICSSKPILSKHATTFERLYLIIRLSAILSKVCTDFGHSAVLFLCANVIITFKNNMCSKRCFLINWLNCVFICLFTFRVILCVDARNKQLSLTFWTYFCLFQFPFLILISEFITLFLARLLLILFYHTFIIFAINCLLPIFFYTFNLFYFYS